MIQADEASICGAAHQRATRIAKLSGYALLVLLIFPSTIVFSQQIGKLSRIEFEGLKHLSKDQLTKASGLVLGQDIDIAAIDAASQRLIDSGLLRNLSYRVRPNSGQAIVTFQIEEATTIKHPVLFDNFVWFTDEELLDAVRRELPTFDGNAPDALNMEVIIHALQVFLSEHKLGGKVEYMPSGDSSGINAHIFSVHGMPMPICTLHFPGAQHVEEARLIKSSQELLGIDYSRSFADSFAITNLFPLYRELGQLRATFATPIAKPETSAKCKDGVDVTIPVTEGLIYKWEKPEWSGNQVLATPQLETALGMKPGEVANGAKFDKGIVAVHKTYGRKGYIAASLHASPNFDDASTKVTYKIEIKEGPQYHMGTLTIKGLPDNLTNLLRGKWEMLRGDAFDQGYADDYFAGPFREVMRGLVEERRQQGKPKVKLVTEQTPNTINLTVDVTIDIRDAPKDEP